MQDTAPFEAIEIRALDVRLTITELTKKAGISRITYWRARGGKHARLDTVTKVLRAMEKALEREEMERTK